MFVHLQGHIKDISYILGRKLGLILFYCNQCHQVLWFSGRAAALPPEGWRFNPRLVCAATSPTWSRMSVTVVLCLLVFNFFGHSVLCFLLISFLAVYPSFSSANSK